MLTGSKQRRRVGFILGLDENSWLGGANLVKNLLSAVLAQPDRAIEPVVFPGGHVSFSLNGSNCRIVRSPLFDAEAFTGKVMRHTSLSFFLHALLRRHSISCLSHCQEGLPEGFAYPSIAWVPDFQHKHFPEFTPAKYHEERDRAFERVCREANVIVASSDFVKNDLIRFLPQYQDKYRTLKFVANFQSHLQATPFAQLQKKYCVGESFFIVPNLFWPNKNHGLLVDALTVLKKSGHKLRVVMTGKTHSAEQPRYFEGLVERARAAGVEDCFHALGIVPMEDLLGLMESAVAFINPAFSEGWSTSVEEAKSLGKQVLLSDNGCHLEQAPARGSYFDPRDGEGLAKLMLSASKEFDLVEDEKQKRLAKEKLPGRVREFAQNYESIVEDCLKKAA